MEMDFNLKKQASSPVLPLCLGKIVLTNLIMVCSSLRKSVYLPLGVPRPFHVQQNLLSFNPLSPDIKMHILLTVLHTFLMELVRRICLNIKTSYPW